MGTAIAVICLMAYPGCAEQPPPEPPVPVAKVAASYERSGGLQPTTERVVITPGRKAAVTTRTAGGALRTVRFRLSVLTVKRLRNGLSQPHFPGFESPPPGSCADCRAYTLEFRGRSVSFPETEIPIWLKKTVGRFEALVDAHRPFH